ncbi:hypothetical protein DID77_00035 [Candidatus Marinamargulisbacteria bacterium SCGC AG-439-L15]|nr:hypothetical protein DID77_00035 [Candidatus Marinamargulisbacteria bacterium SCGC AG-439-L15]
MSFYIDPMIFAGKKELNSYVNQQLGKKGFNKSFSFDDALNEKMSENTDSQGSGYYVDDKVLSVEDRDIDSVHNQSKEPSKRRGVHREESRFGDFRQSREMPGQLQLTRGRRFIPQTESSDDNELRNQEIVKTVVEWNVMLWTRKSQGKSQKKRVDKNKKNKKEEAAENEKEAAKAIARANSLRKEEESKASARAKKKSKG